MKYVQRYEDLETILMRFVTSILLALDLFDYSYGTAWHPQAALPTAMWPSGPADMVQNHCKEDNHCRCLLVVIDHLHHRLEGGDVQVRCWVNYIYLGEDNDDGEQEDTDHAHKQGNIIKSLLLLFLCCFFLLQIFE